MKLVGSILIIFASVIASYFYEKKLKESIVKTDELYDFIEYTKNKIEYFSMPINEVFDSYTRDNSSINDLINKKELCELDFLDNGVKDDIKSFFDKLGRGYKKEQVALCEYTLKIIESSRDKMKMEFTKKSKIFRSLSLFAGIGCVILLV